MSFGWQISRRDNITNSHWFMMLDWNTNVRATWYTPELLLLTPENAHVQPVQLWFLFSSLMQKDCVMLHHWPFLWKMCLINVLLICMTFGLCESNQSQSFCNILQVCSLIFSTVSHTFKATHCGLAVLVGRGFDRVWLWNLTSSMIRADQVWQVALWRKRRQRLLLDEGRLLSGRLPWFSSHPVMFPQLLSDGYYHLQISWAEVFVGYWICL